jgi:hypothetical protein
MPHSILHTDWRVALVTLLATYATSFLLSRAICQRD